MSNSNDQLDASIEIVTPENIAFQYRLAGPFRRMLAYLIDVAIRAIACWLLFIVVGLFFETALRGIVLGGVFLAMFALFWFYETLFEAFWNGQTPGKRMLGLRVLSVEGRPINGMQAVLRNVLRVVDLQPGIFCQVGLVAATANKRFQRLGDLVAGTMVVVDQRPWQHGLVWTQDEETIRLASLIPPQFTAPRTMARALAAYVPRRRAFSWQRRQEIAAYLGVPLRESFGLPPDTDLDLLLCAAYHRTFVADGQMTT